MIGLLAFVVPSLRDMILTLLALAVLAFVFWLWDQRVPGDSTMKTVIKALACFFLIIWLLNLFGFI